MRTLLAVCQKCWEPNFPEMMDSFISICKFGSFKNPSATITSLSEFCFRFRIILLVKTKKVISMNYGSSTWRWVWLNLILMIRDTYINSNLKRHTKFTSSSRSTEFKDFLPWNISQKITKSVIISKRIVINYSMP